MLGLESASGRALCFPFFLLAATACLGSGEEAPVEKNLGQQLDREGLRCPAGFRRLPLRVAQLQSDMRGGVWIAEADAPTSLRSRKATWVWHYRGDLSRTQAWKIPEGIVLSPEHPLYFAEHMRSSNEHPGVFEMMLAGERSILFSGLRLLDEANASEEAEETMPAARVESQVHQLVFPTGASANFWVKWGNDSIRLQWASPPLHVALFPDREHAFYLIEAHPYRPGFGPACGGAAELRHFVWMEASIRAEPSLKTEVHAYVHSGIAYRGELARLDPQLRAIGEDAAMVSLRVLVRGHLEWAGQVRREGQPPAMAKYRLDSRGERQWFELVTSLFPDGRAYSLSEYKVYPESPRYATQLQSDIDPAEGTFYAITKANNYSSAALLQKVHHTTVLRYEALRGDVVALAASRPEDLWLQTREGAGCFRLRTSHCEDLFESLKSEGIARLDGRGWIVQGKEGGYLVGHCLPSEKYYAFPMDSSAPIAEMLKGSGIALEPSQRSTSELQAEIRARLRGMGWSEVPVPVDIRTLGPARHPCAENYVQRRSGNPELAARCDALGQNDVRLSCPPTWSDLDKILAMLKVEVMNSRSPDADPPPILLSGDESDKASAPALCRYTRNASLTAAQRTLWEVSAKEYEPDHLFPLFAGSRDRSEALLPVSPHFNKSYGGQETAALQAMRNAACWGAELPRYRLECEGWSYRP